MHTYSSQVLIVGTGAGGAVAASVLARAGVNTVILEQGRRWTPEEHGDVISSFTGMYVNGGITVALGRPPIPIPLGATVGGSTTVNSSTCFRPPRDKVALWNGIDYETLEPCCAAVEQRIHAVPVDETLLGGNYRVLKRGCDAMGVEIRPLVHNLDGCQGSGRCVFGCPTGAKQSTDRNFIPDALEAGARLYAEHRVTGVLRDGNRLVGLTGQSAGRSFEARAEVIVLAMGTLATPAFMLRHGLAATSGRVGRGLHIHPACRVAAEFEEVVDGHIGLPQGAYIDHWAGHGIMLEGISLPPGLLLSALPGAGMTFKELTTRYRHIASFGLMVNDTSEGRVRRGVGATPYMVFYQLNQADAERLRFGMARLGELFFAAGAQRLFTNVLPMPVIEHPDALREFEQNRVTPESFELMAFHPTGTCAMNNDRALGVVNAELQVHDMPNLYVMDGSVIPNALGVNPQITIMALAWHGATKLAERLTRRQSA